MEENGLRHCPRCGGQLRLVNVIAPYGERPQIHIYECGRCDQPEFQTKDVGGS